MFTDSCLLQLCLHFLVHYIFVNSGEKGRETYYVNSLFIGEVQAVYSTVSGTVYSTVFPN